MASNHLPFRSRDGQQFCVSNVVPIRFEATRADTNQVVDQYSPLCCQPPTYATPFIIQAPEHYLDPQLDLLHQGPWSNITSQQATPHEQQSGLWIQTQLQLYPAQESPYHSPQTPQAAVSPPHFTSQSMYRSYSNMTAISSSSCESGVECLAGHWYSSPQQGDFCEQFSAQPACAYSKEECPTPTDSQGASDHEDPHGHIHLTHPHILSSSARGARPSAPGFTCRVCSRTFSRKSHLKQHQQRHVTELSRPSCSICGKDYGRRADLARHVRSKHEENRFWCRYCGNIYNRSDILRRHETDSCRGKRPKDRQTRKRRRQQFAAKL